MYLIFFFLLSWVPFLLMFVYVHNVKTNEMESQRLKIEELESTVSFQNLRSF